MSFEIKVRNYLKEFQRVFTTATRAGATSSEMATRPIVHQFIQELFAEYKKPSQNLDIHHDVSYTRGDRPDWRIEDVENFGIYCFGDHKNLSLNSPFKLKPIEELQIKRYLAYGRPVFVFDGIEFLFFEPNQAKPRRTSLIQKPLSLNNDWAANSVDLSVEYEVHNLLKSSGFRKWTESQLISQLALRARVLSDELISLLRAPEGSGNTVIENQLIVALHLLRDELATHHDATLRNDTSCADFIVQVLTFGLFYAHTKVLNKSISPNERRVAIKNFWKRPHENNDLRVFSFMESDLEKYLNGNNVIGLWNDDVTKVLAHAEYMGVEPGPKDFHSLFEEFLINFDSDTRFDRGAFYTPKLLTDWVVDGVEKIFQRYFSASKKKIIEKIIDPCCGTGGFLESIAENFKGLEQETVLAGFEILPAPYALANYRLSEVFSKSHKKFDLRIVLTDTLSDKIFSKITDDKKWANIELKVAKEVCEAPLRVVVGNPPSSDRVVSDSSRKIIDALLDDFRPPKSAISSRQNIQKALNNEAYRFLRWSADRVLESKSGILALVLPGAFAYSVSFKYARKWFLSNFQKIYILELDGDARSSGTQSIFPVLQGRLVMFAIKDDAETTSIELCNLYHLDVSVNKKNEKIDFLKNRFSFEVFNKIDIDFENFKFTPLAKYPKDLWDLCWPLSASSNLNGIFKSSCSGIKPAPTSLVFHTQKNILLRRSSDFGLSNEKVNLDELIKKWFSGQAKLPKNDKFSEKVRAELSKVSNSPTQIGRYIYRPFVSGWAVISSKLMEALAETPGKGTRFRPEIKEAFDAGASGIAFASTPRDLSATITRFTSFVWGLPDNDLVSRGSARIYCDLYPVKNKNSSSVITSNFTPEFFNIFKVDGYTSKEILFYIYAITSCSSYINKFDGVLYELSPTNLPRVPILSDPVLRKKIIELGKKIAECENFDLEILSKTSFEIEWPDGQEEFQLSSYKYDFESNKLLLIGIDGSLSIGGVPPELPEIYISGYKVLEAWIRSRKYDYLKRKFNKSDGNDLLDVLSRISTQIDCLNDVDLILDMAFEENSFIPSTIL